MTISDALKVVIIRSVPPVTGQEQSWILLQPL